MFTSAAWLDLDSRVGGELSKPSPQGFTIPFYTLGIELGIDWGQMHKFTTRRPVCCLHLLFAPWPAGFGEGVSLGSANFWRVHPAWPHQLSLMRQ
jgi:hypothetical protein